MANAKLYRWKNEMLTLRQLCDLHNMKKATVEKRLKRMSLRDALTRPANRGGPRKHKNAKPLPFIEPKPGRRLCLGTLHGEEDFYFDSTDVRRVHFCPRCQQYRENIFKFHHTTEDFRGHGR